MTLNSIYNKARYQDPESRVVAFRKLPEGKLFRSEAEAAVRAEEAAVAKLQRSLDAALFGGQAHRANRSNNNPFGRNIERPRTKHLIHLISEARMKLQVVRSLLAGESVTE